MKFIYNDGGREAAGYKGKAGDCVCRAIAIATDLPYTTVYALIAAGNGNQKRSKKSAKRSASAREGVHVQRKWFKEMMRKMGFEWVACMGIGTGCKVHLKDGELPAGRLVVSVSKHYTCVIDGVINDTYSPYRNGSYIRMVNGIETRGTNYRCVYGYWKLNRK